MSGTFLIADVRGYTRFTQEHGDSAVQLGEADVMLDDPPPERIHEIVTSFPTQAHPYVRAIVYYMFLNTSIPPLDDAPVRRAVNAAPWLPLINERGIDLVSERVGNYQHNPQLGVLLDQFWVE